MIEIKKTYKNYVGGKYVRSESGKTFTLSLKNDSFEVPLTSKKDIRDAVTASKKGFQNWSQISPYTKTQILYRLSEMIEGNKDRFTDLKRTCLDYKNIIPINATKRVFSKPTKYALAYECDPS